MERAGAKQSGAPLGPARDDRWNGTGESDAVASAAGAAHGESPRVVHAAGGARFLGDVKSSLGDAKSSLGGAKSSLGGR